jgi:hypothetical protein
MILFLCFSTRKEGEEESIFDENGSLKRLNKNSDKTLFKIFLGDGILISFLRGIPPTKRKLILTTISLLTFLQNSVPIFMIIVYSNVLVACLFPEGKLNQRTVCIQQVRAAHFSVKKETLPV